MHTCGTCPGVWEHVSYTTMELFCCSPPYLFQKRFTFTYLCMQACLSECMPHVCRCVWWSEEGIGFPGGGNIGSFDPRRFWELNPGSLEEQQQGLLTTGSSLQLQERSRRYVYDVLICPRSTLNTVLSVQPNFKLLVSPFMVLCLLPPCWHTRDVLAPVVFLFISRL